MLLLKYGDNMKKILIYLCILFCITGCNKEEEKKKLSYEIEDRTLNSDYSCATALEKFYSDELYDYSFSCIKSNYVIVVFSNGSEKNIVDALNDKDVKVEDLDTFNIKYYKTEKNRP